MENCISCKRLLDIEPVKCPYCGVTHREKPQTYASHFGASLVLLAFCGPGGFLLGRASGPVPAEPVVAAHAKAVPPSRPVTPMPAPPAAVIQTEAPRLDASSEENRRAAMKHWQSGVIYYQKGDYSKARDEWLLCKQFEPGNPDCQNGLQRIDQTYGN